MPTRQATARWDGSFGDGAGRMAFGSGAFEGAYSAQSRFEEGEGTNPEELIGAAHAGCFSMALALILGDAGHEPESIETEAEVSIVKAGDGIRDRSHRSAHHRQGARESSRASSSVMPRPRSRAVRSRRRSAASARSASRRGWRKASALRRRAPFRTLPRHAQQRLPRGRRGQGLLQGGRAVRRGRRLSQPGRLQAVRGPRGDEA